MRFLVTGSNGLVGSRLCNLLSRAGHELVATSRGERRVQGAFDYASCELSQRAAVAAVVQAARPEVIVHCASMTDVDGCERDPLAAWAANVDAAANLALAARASGVHLLHVSTDYVFDGERGPYGEEDVPNPKGAYAVTKYAGEQAVRTLAPSWAIARTAVVYGWPPAARPNFGSWLVTSLSQKKPVKLFEDQVVSPSLADSVAAMLKELGEKKLSGIWNTCGGEVVDRVRFGRALCEVFGFDTALVIPSRMKDVNLPSPRPPRSGLRTDKVSGALEAKPLSLGESLKRFHAAWKGRT